MKRLILFCMFSLLTICVVQAQFILALQIKTGSDDLRGGNDNLNLIVLMKSGTQVRFNNINLGGRLADNSTYNATQIVQSGKIADVAGFRFETTLGGGMGGDNWNLNGLVVNGIVNNVATKMIEVSGNPLFRFTGDQRVKDFLCTTPATPATSATPAAKAVMTKFNPTTQGFKFTNNFTNIFISGIDWVTGGLCGGMSYAALDYYKANKTIPQQDYMPAEGMPLQSYLYDRQMKSMAENVDRWGEFFINPGGARNREFFNWGLQAGSGQLGRLMSYIDRGEPVVLGLSSCGSGCMGDHQVLAIGYELGRYKGDLGYFADDLTIFVCDPNYPGKTMKLKPYFSLGYFSYPEERGNPRWRTYFVDTKYTPQNPPTITNSPNEIMVTFVTGNDDLRGGNDNVNLVMPGLTDPMNPGKILEFRNVNNGKRWVNGSSQTISRPLADNVYNAQIKSILLKTTFGGGIGGDNWNLNGLTIKTRIHGVVTELYKVEGTPFMRFTGDNKELIINIAGSKRPL